MSNYFDREVYDSNFQIQDNQIGYPVFVNGINVYEYNADLIEYDLKPAKISYDSFKKIGKYSYIVNQYKNGDNGIEFSFYVGGATYTEAQLNINKLIRDFQKDAPVVVSVGDSEFEYLCILTDVSISDTKVLHFYKVDISTIAVKRLPLVELKYSTSQIASEIKIYNNGSVASGLLAFWHSTKKGSTIKFAYGQESYTTITVNNANLYYYHVIDGLDGKVLRGSANNPTFDGYVNNFINTDLYQFPVVGPGENKIKFTQTYGDITELTLKYYPTFLV